MMGSYPSILMKFVLDFLRDCNESLMRLDGEVPEGLWKDLDEVFRGVGDAIDALDYILEHLEDYS